jgi:conjugative transfer region protein TrbK
MRLQPRNIGVFARALGLLFVATVLAVAAMRLRGNEDQAPLSLAVPSILSDPLSLEMVRCQALGIAAESDAGCKAAWAENRRRFFAPLSGATTPASEPGSINKAEGR